MRDLIVLFGVNILDAPAFQDQHLALADHQFGTSFCIQHWQLPGSSGFSEKPDPADNVTTNAQRKRMFQIGDRRVLSADLGKLVRQVYRRLLFVQRVTTFFRLIQPEECAPMY